jgi:hypothetical protein
VGKKALVRHIHCDRSSQGPAGKNRPTPSRLTALFFYYLFSFLLFEAHRWMSAKSRSYGPLKSSEDMRGEGVECLGQQDTAE